MPNELLSAAQEARTQAREAAQLQFLTWVREFATWLLERIPQWEAQLHRTNQLYAAVLNDADNAVINIVTGIVGKTQVHVDDVDRRIERLEGQVAELAATIATVVSRGDDSERTP